MNTKQAILVILGLGEGDKPRAAKFNPDDVETATKAAGLMGLKIARAETPEALAIAKDLPEGKIFATGKSLMPLMRREVYDKLLSAITLIDPKAEPILDKPKATPGKPVTVSVLVPDPWFKIAEGTVVLCQDDSAKPKDRAWWECTVSGVSKDGKLLTVRWAIFPTFKPFTVKRSSVAILPSKN